MMELPVKPDETRWASMSFMDQMANIGSESALLELCRSRELFAGAYLEKDSGTLNWLDSYFGHFAISSRLGR